VKGKVLIGLVAAALLIVVAIAVTRDDPDSAADQATGSSTSATDRSSMDDPDVDGDGEDDGQSVAEALIPGAGTGAHGDLVAAFYRQFERAMRRNDATVLFDHLHPMVVERYSESVCRAYVDSLVRSDSIVQLVAIGPAEPFGWTADGVTTPVDNGIAVRLRGGPPGQPIESDDHVAVVDGKVRWFTDCGVASQRAR
jgi:hypothetical protein